MPSMSQVAAKSAAEAHTTLCLFAGVERLLSGSDIKGERCQEIASEMIALAGKAQQLALRDYDRHVANLATI